MSHFSCLVILPKEVQTVDETVVYPVVAELLAPYDEMIVVDPYERPCWCVGQAARAAVRQRVDEQYGTPNDIRKGYVHPYPPPPVEDGEESFFAWMNDKAKQSANDAAWQEMIRPHEEACVLLFEQHPLKDAARPDCTTCAGTGVETTTDNPKSTWDWWSIGGRWADVFGEGKDILPLTDLPPGWSVFAIVTPDGSWNAKGDMGWWGRVSNEQKDWPALQYEIASAFPEHYGVLVDCHI